MMLRVMNLIPFTLMFILYSLTPFSEARCPFQNPFWFIDKPYADNVYDEITGEMVANKIRVIWGRLENFQCIDYFKIEYFHRQTKLDPTSSQSLLKATDRIDRGKRYFDIENVIPCTEYYFKVVAAEDWSDTVREDFMVYSEMAVFTVKYTPRFIAPPRFKEKRRIVFKPQPPPPNDVQDVATVDAIGETDVHSEEILVPKEEIFYNIRWRLKDIDYPICLNHFELHYLDMFDFNSTKFLRSVIQPFKRPKFLVQIQSIEFGAECDFDVQLIFKMYGIHRQATTLYWTPPPCVFTTTTVPPPTSSTLNYTAYFNDTDTADYNMQFENSNSSYSNESSSDYNFQDIEETNSYDMNANESSSNPVFSPTNTPIDEEKEATTRSYAEEMKATRAQIGLLKEDYEKNGWQDFTELKDSFFQSMKDFLIQMRDEDIEEGRDQMLFEDGKHTIFVNAKYY